MRVGDLDVHLDGLVVGLVLISTQFKIRTMRDEDAG